ncbi:MAG: immunoglobulin domain-containing protein [Verrucomicrobiota bacterium]
MTKTLRILLAAGITGLASLTTANADISVTASGTTGGSTYALDGSPYSQSFDTLPASGTFTWTNNSTLPGWYAADGTGNLNTAAVTTSGSGNAAALILASVGTSGNPDRALAYHTQVESAPTHLGLAFANNSGQELTSFTLAYSPEQWREAATGRSVTVTVQYQGGAALADLHAATGWTTIPGLDFSTYEGSVSSATTLTAPNIPVSVPAGTSLWIRWRFSNTATTATNAHDILAIDNVTFSATSGTPVPTAPSITTHPAPQSASVGGSASFTVAATGTAPLSYQWRKNSVNLDTLANPSAASATLSLTNLALADNGGSYACVVTNTLDSATSNPATLTVTTAPPVAPSITTHPVSQTVTAGSSVTFSVVATGTAPLTYQWKFGVDDIPGETGSSLVINNVQAAITGSYTVTVTNLVNSATSSPATLTIGTPPPATGYSKYNLTGFATLGSGTTGGGEIPEANAAYRKCATPLEFVTAIRDSNKTAGVVKVIEITANLNLGWNEIDAATKALTSNPIHEHAQPKLHPTLLASGVSVIDIIAKSGLTIFSANGATIKHITFNIKSTSNIIIRNLKFDEMWEWDEATKGDYDSNDWDFMVLSNGGTASNVWIDHCTFTKAYDGIADMKKGTQNITLSWCKYIGDDGATNANSHVRVQIAALEANKSSYAFYNFLRTNGFSQEDIVQVIQGHDKGHLMGATEKDALNNVLSATFHHQWFTNLWDRCVPRLRGGQVHNYNILVDNTTALVARRMRDARANAMSSTARNTLNSTYSFNPFLNGSISTEGGAILVEKSIYQDCITPLRNNQTDVSDPTYTGKIKSTDSIYIMHNTNGTTTTVRGDSTDAGNPMGPFQAPAIPFSWNTTDGNRPYPAPPMDDPTDLPALLSSGAGAGTLLWDKSNWLKTTYVDPAPDTFAAWAARNGVSDPNADPDFDGNRNLLEFALGLNPQQASTQGLPVLSTAAGQQVFRYTRPNNLGGLTYTVQTSTDLVNWNGTLATVVESSTATTETLVAIVPQGDATRYTRLRIYQQ